MKPKIGSQPMKEMPAMSSDRDERSQIPPEADLSTGSD